MKKKMTVVTPTYNRAYIIKKCYDSLVKQTNQSFTWLVVDDGSTDDTEELIKQLKKEKLINIEYIKKENGGKASALNVAFDYLMTKYWVCLDSDDYFADDAIEIALDQLNIIDNNERFCGILALRNYPNGEVFGGKRIPTEVKSITTLEMRNKYKLDTESIQFYKTEITKEYRFPEIEGEKFISSEYFSDLLNEEYVFYVSQDTFCYCEYLDDGLTKNKVAVIKKNPKGYTLIMKNRYERTDKLYPKSLWGLKYISGSFLSNYKFKEIVNKTSNPLLLTFLYPFGWLVYRLRF